MSKPTSEPESTFEKLCKAYVDFSLLHPSLFDVLFNERAPTDIVQKDNAALLMSRPNLLSNAMRALYNKYVIPATEDQILRGCMLIWAQLHGLIVSGNSGSISPLIVNYEWSGSESLDETAVLENLIKQMTNDLYTTLRLQQATLKAEGKI